MDAETMLPSLGIEHVQLMELATLQTGSEMKHYYLAVHREADGELQLDFLVATDSGLEPAAEVEGSTLTLLVAERGRESWNSHSIQLSRQRPFESEAGVFQGRLPERVRTMEITAVIPKLRIGGQRLHASFTMAVTVAGGE